MESVILGFGFRSTAQGIRNPANDLNPQSGFTDKDWDQVPGIRNPQSKTVLDSSKYGVESEKALLSSTYSYSPYEGRVPPSLLFGSRLCKSGMLTQVSEKTVMLTF